jgi:hypothetical protein
MIDVTREAHIQHAARVLRRWGLGGLAATVLADGGPLTFLGAQALYFAAPVLGAFSGGEGVNAWAALLEDPAAARALAAELRGDGGPKQTP